MSSICLEKVAYYVFLGFETKRVPSTSLYSLGIEKGKEEPCEELVDYGPEVDELLVSKRVPWI
jgi:hypothetical protein